MILDNEPLTAEEFEELHPDPATTEQWAEVCKKQGIPMIAGELLDGMSGMIAANLVIPMWWEDDRMEEWLAIAVWRQENGLEATPRDLEALLWSARATLARELPKRPDGGQTVTVAPREQRRRELEAVYLIDELNLTNINAAAVMGWGIDKGMIPDLAAGGRARYFTVLPVLHLDGELMKEIKEKHRQEQEKGKTNAQIATRYTPRKRPRK